jgi:hypothetical protein
LPFGFRDLVGNGGSTGSHNTLGRAEETAEALPPLMVDTGELLERSSRSSEAA